MCHVGVKEDSHWHICGIIIRFGLLRRPEKVKEDSHWHICGIPSVFYTDHGSDFTSKHIEQVAADLGIELIFPRKGCLADAAKSSVSFAA